MRTENRYNHPMKRIRYLIEAGILWILMSVFRLLPVQTASALGGLIGRGVGPRLAASRKALANIREALPACDHATQKQIVHDMWDNLGRVMAEYPHLVTIARQRVTVENIDLFKRLQADGLPAVIAAAHLANWEIACPAAFYHAGIELDLVYRAPNNPYVDKLLSRAREIRPGQRTMPKSKTGARDIVRSLAEKRHVGILIDQKYNEGIAVPFFGRPAMTSPAFVQLAQKFKCPLIMTRIERLPHARFHISAKEIPVTDDTGAPLPVETVIAAAHKDLEDWIRARPGQWLWLHRRWSDRAEREYKNQIRGIVSQS